MKPLWDKGVVINDIMHNLTVGNDPLYDQWLLRWDCIGSAAQAKSLQKIGILSSDETRQLLNALHSLLIDIDAGNIRILPELEDAHTTLENLLTQQIGDAGKKLHTGRSRNDQVILAIRLYLRDIAVQWLQALLSLSEALIQRFNACAEILMPGYTHLQPAMPANMGMWLHAFLEGSVELIRDGLSYLDQIDRSPLGAAAGFGSSLPIDREYIASLLGFSQAQRSFIDIQNSRGRYEERLLFWATQIGALWEKFAWDISLYCTREYGFFSLPDSLTTGSSIMPQKKNPDLVELLRARCAKIRGYLSEMQWIIGKLPSNYHRDLQLSKEPLFKTVQEIKNIFDSVSLIVQKLQVHPEAMSQKMGNELYATYEAYRQVRQGIAFRDAYQQTAKLVEIGHIFPKDYTAETAQVIQEVQFYFEKTVAELNTQKQSIANYSQKLSLMEDRVLTE